GGAGGGPSLERGGGVGGGAGRRAAPDGDDAGGGVPGRSLPRALVGMGREEFERASRIFRIDEERVNRVYRRDNLEVPVLPGVVVGPGDRRGASVVRPVAPG